LLSGNIDLRNELLKVPVDRDTPETDMRMQLSDYPRAGALD
jgi:hypothetical protein